MSIYSDVTGMLRSALQLDEGLVQLNLDSGLLGVIPEFDSMAVVTVLTALEDHYGFIIEDDEVDASTFETVGSFIQFVEEKYNSIT
ncbi:MAG: hypothetical protein KUG72_02875 [Pseudomonadales bacterium]|nr:hypothetical protein [Pseudomonadales bacterium]